MSKKDTNDSKKSDKSNLADKKRKSIDKSAKEKELSMTKRIKEEKNLRNQAINFPYDFLFKICLIIFILSFVSNYIGYSNSLNDSLLKSFFIFTAFYLAIGLLLTILFYFGAEIKRLHAEEERKMNEEKEKWERERYELQQAKLEEELRAGEIRRQEELRKFRELKNRKYNELPPGSNFNNNQVNVFEDGGYSGKEVFPESVNRYSIPEEDNVPA